MNQVHQIPCPYCGSGSSRAWAKENGFTAVKCSNCGLVFVNPRPNGGMVAAAVESGVHVTLGGHNVVGRRVASKVEEYKKLIARTHVDIWRSGELITWLDVGAGFGELVEAVQSLAPVGSFVVGLEPMKPKANSASALGLNIINGYLMDVPGEFQFASLINVFSHIPDFRSFLEELKKKLKPGGEFLMLTGNAGDVPNVSDVPGELDLPDHLVFAGRVHVVGFLEQAGFRILSIDEVRIDTPTLWVKNAVKKMVGRPTNLVTPYSSPYRDLIVRAKLSV